MVKSHLKRIAAPRTWDIDRKTTKFIARPKPGQHTLQLGMPLAVLLKEILKKMKTNKELKIVVRNQEVLVDGKRRYDIKFMIGLMDVLAIPKLKENYRMLINTKNRLYLRQIDEKEASFKPCKLVNKIMLGKDKMQLHLSDGRNILVKKNDYKTGDTLVLELPSQKILDHIKLEKGCTILLYKGKHVGLIGQVDEVKGSTIHFTANKGKYETNKSYAFVIGKEKPLIKIKE